MHISKIKNPNGTVEIYFEGVGHWDDCNKKDEWWQPSINADGDVRTIDCAFKQRCKEVKQEARPWIVTVVPGSALPKQISDIFRVIPNPGK